MKKRKAYILGSTTNCMFEYEMGRRDGKIQILELMHKSFCSFKDCSHGNPCWIIQEIKRLREEHYEITNKDCS